MTFPTFYRKSMIVAAKICALYFILAWLFPFIPPHWVYFYSLFVIVAWYVIVEIL